MRHGRSRSQQAAASTGWTGSPGRSGGDISPSGGGGGGGVTEEGGAGGGSGSSNAQFVSFFSLSLFTYAF